MGWSICQDPHQKLKDFLKERTRGYDQTDDQGQRRASVCITYHYAMGSPGSGVLYKVMENHRYAPDKVTIVERERWIGVDLIKYYGGRGRSDGWGYKDMEASMGPTSIGCPLKYVDELVPEPQPCAKGGPCDLKWPYPEGHEKSCRKCHGCSRCWEKSWRQGVRERHAAQKRERDFLKSLKPGDVIVIKKGWSGAGDEEVVQEVYPRRRKLKAGGWVIPSKAIDVDASLLAVGVDKAAH